MAGLTLVVELRFVKDLQDDSGLGDEPQGPRSTTVAGWHRPLQLLVLLLLVVERAQT